MASRFRTCDLPGGSAFDKNLPPRVSACRGNGEFGDDDELDDWGELDGCESPELDDEPFDPEPTDDEIWGDFQWDDESDDDVLPPDELWSDADWE